jgi:cytidyltransferase-like protein
MSKAIVMGSFDDLRSADIRFLEEAARFGRPHVLLWSDELVLKFEGKPPKFPLDERLYLLRAIRHVMAVRVVNELETPDTWPELAYPESTTWAVNETDDNDSKRGFCVAHQLNYQVIPSSILREFPDGKSIPVEQNSARKKVVVTGCYDWFHSGHVRFFEEASELGDLYVVAGSDENVRLLKGAGHPLFPQDERRYMVGSIRFVKQALISTGSGWMDAEPEIAHIQPDIYVVNEDGDKPEKRDFCQTHLIEYVVLRRTPKEGLPKRQSVDLRGF